MSKSFLKTVRKQFLTWKGDPNLCQGRFSKHVETRSASVHIDIETSSASTIIPVSYVVRCMFSRAASNVNLEFEREATLATLEEVFNDMLQKVSSIHSQYANIDKQIGLQQLATAGWCLLKLIAIVFAVYKSHAKAVASSRRLLNAFGVSTGALQEPNHELTTSELSVRAEKVLELHMPTHVATYMALLVSRKVYGLASFLATESIKRARHIAKAALVYKMQAYTYKMLEKQRQRSSIAGK